MKSKLEAAGLKGVSLSYAGIGTPPFRNHIAICIKGQNNSKEKIPKLSNS
ncbi:hypothetical protein GX563_09475 [Candidatus Bathyarchaeota archaeon]|nr:hypothetical protein [Candidatus Bathyarchaeota archaeon]